MLTFEEAKHFSQLLLSRYVNIVEIGGALAPITITDINSEISDADNATNSIKFKYKYSSHHLPIDNIGDLVPPVAVFWYRRFTLSDFS